MERLSYTVSAAKAAKGSRRQAITGVVASGNLEVLAERALPAVGPGRRRQGPIRARR